MTVAEGLKRFRKNAKLRQEDIANAIGVHRQVYQRYESGKVLPVITALIKIADVYKVSTDYLLGRSNTPNPIEEGAAEVQEAREFRLALKKFVEETRI